MTEKSLKEGNVSFETEGRLLQELGERLVASPEVALVELIKNAYDADSPTCIVRLSEKEKSLEVLDDGSGMTLDAFRSRWMRIATSHKTSERLSPTYGRRVTGQKGIGRFAVRFLGHTLHLSTVAFDEKRGHKTRLVATFPWQKIDGARQLGSALISFRLFRARDDAQCGTTLTIKELKSGGAFTKTADFRTNVLKIVTPIDGLERGRFRRVATAERKKDPGFRVNLPGGAEGGGADDLNLAKTVLDHAWAALKISLDKGKLSFNIEFGDGRKAAPFSIPFKSSISSGLFADIRFFPRRPGIFKGTEVRGNTAWRWVRDNAGVAVVDHGFRVKPYGFPEDDWLQLDADRSHNERKWRSRIAEEHFPISRAEKEDPAVNPMLNLPGNLQLVGAVFVESGPASVSKRENDLTPSMDREGFLKNTAYKELVEIVRAGLEYLAKADKLRLLEALQRRAKDAASGVRAEFKAAIEYIEKSQTLTEVHKARLIADYSGIAKRIEEVEEYDREARRKLEVMSSMGVVAGFMTHEATRIVSGLKDAVAELKVLAPRHPSLSLSLGRIEDGYNTFKGQLDYTRMFVDSVQDGGISAFRAAPQIKRIIDKFGGFATSRGIIVRAEIGKDVEVPAMPITVYSGVLLNLYTNAVKAIVAAKSQTDQPYIIFRGWTESKMHVIEVLDTGIGIPPSIRTRIWDPLFTTTSRLNNPLGSGMGLGLSLVKQLVIQIGGKIGIVDAPAGFSTCFRVEFPNKAKS